MSLPVRSYLWFSFRFGSAAEGLAPTLGCCNAVVLCALNLNHCREYLDDVELFRGCSEKLLDSMGVLLREIQVEIYK